MEERKPLSWRGIGIVAGLALAVLFCLPKWQVKQAKVDQGSLLLDDEYQLAKLEDEYRRTLAQILGGLGLLYGLSLAERRIVATENSVSVAQEGQVTERFTRAIDQLGQEGNDKMAIRLGGFYALERIAKDSEKDHGPVMEVLTAYVREKAPRKNDDYEPQADERPPTDIQAILTVIGRRETTGKGRRNDRLNLSKTHLVGADLFDANLNGTILSGADLYEADLIGADLSRADLSEAILSRADLDGANLDGAKNLTPGVMLAKNWREAHLPDYLQHLKD